MKLSELSIEYLNMDIKVYDFSRAMIGRIIEINGEIIKIEWSNALDDLAKGIIWYP